MGALCADPQSCVGGSWLERRPGRTICLLLKPCSSEVTSFFFVSSMAATKVNILRETVVLVAAVVVLSSLVGEEDSLFLLVVGDCEDSPPLRRWFQRRNQPLVLDEFKEVVDDPLAMEDVEEEAWERPLPFIVVLDAVVVVEADPSFLV